jgi:hypothetical protein
MRFIKEHLSAGNNYNWTDEFIFDGTPSRRLFDRQNGNQLLFIINLYASQNDKFSEDQVQRVEEMLVNKLPEEIKSEISVLNWLKENGQVFLIRQ